MKPLSLNLSKMKKVGGDAHSSTFEHPSGHKMVIAHHAVSALQRKQLEKMTVAEPQKMADGGEVLPAELADLQTMQQEPGPVTSPSMASRVGSTIGNGFRDAFGAVKTVGGMLGDAADYAGDKTIPPAVDFAQGVLGTPAQAAEPAPMQDQVHMQQAMPVPGDGAPQAPAQSALGNAVMSGAGNVEGAYGQGMQAIREQQAVETQKAKANEAIQQKDMQQREALAQTFEQSRKEFTDQQQHFMKDYAEQHINPRHYQESMSTGDKISTGIGLFLGGFSTPFTHQGNPAMDFLNKQIDRDIRAQEARLEQSKTLLGANQAMFHDSVIAQNQTRMNMNDIYDHKIQLAATQLGTPQAKANADMASAKFAMENQGLLFQNAMRKTLLQSQQQSQGDPESAFKAQTHILRMMGNEPMAKDLEAKHVPGVGQASKEVPNEVMKELIARQDLQHKIENLQKFAQQNSGSLNPAVVKEGHALASLVQDAYRRGNNQGVFKESEKNFVEGIVNSDPTQFFQKYRSGQGYKAMASDNLGTLNGLKQGYGLPVSQQSEQPQYKVVNGVKYMRGPNGEAVRVK